MVRKTDFNENPVVSLALDLDFGLRLRVCQKADCKASAEVLTDSASDIIMSALSVNSRSVIAAPFEQSVISHRLQVAMREDAGLGTVAVFVFKSQANVTYLPPSLPLPRHNC